MASSNSNLRLYISGFPPRTPESEIKELCSRFGKVVNVDIIPGRRFGFVTFAAHDAATLAVYGINQELLRGIYKLEADWAKVKRDDDRERRDDRDRRNGREKNDGVAKQASGTAQGGGEPVVEVEKVKSTGPRYIPGSDADQPTNVIAPVATKVPTTNGTAKPASPAPAPHSLEPGSKTYAEDSPDLEITIHDTVTHEVKYYFKVKSLPALREFLVSEGNGIPETQLLHSSAPQKDKNQITYAGLPVVHVYADLVGKEMLEARDNKQQREKTIQESRRIRGYRVPAAKVPLRTQRVPVAELQHLLTQKGYQKVFINLDSTNGPLAPLHPSWAPAPHSYAYRKGNAIVYFSNDSGIVSWCELFHTTNNTYKDLLPILGKYDVCIFNVVKQAFIAPEQLQ